jgi:hypothetical protein
MKRQRGRGRKPGGGGGGGNYHNNNNQGGHQHPNRQLETNGPDTKFRGTAAYIYERYLQLARDAQSSGDRVLGENYLQYADHYFRLVRSMQPAAPVQQQQNYNDGGVYDGDEGGSEGDSSDGSEARGEGNEPPAGEAQGERQQREDGGDRGDGGQRRGRNRRRFRPDGEREGGGAEAREGEERPEQREPRGERSEGGEPREPREAPREAREPRRDRSEGGEPRRERQPREDRDSAGREGFSDGPKPAFLRTGGSGTSE